MKNFHDTINYARPVHFKGRNGVWAATELDILERDVVVILTPITSKNKLARCEIQIGRFDLVGFMEHLVSEDPIGKFEFRHGITQFLGRNGRFKCIGISVLKAYRMWTFWPITSKQDNGSCWIEVPEESFSELIHKLAIIVRRHRADSAEAAGVCSGSEGLRPG